MLPFFIALSLTSGRTALDQEHCGCIEFNTFGGGSTAVLFRDLMPELKPGVEREKWHGQIREWRWRASLEGKPQKLLPGGKWLWIFKEPNSGLLLMVIADDVTYTRTKEDVEVEERKTWPAEWLRKFR
jgi:hypothetical protein